MVTWFSALDSPTAERVSAIVDAATAADGTTPISEQAVHSLTSGSEVRHLVHSEGGRVVGYANLVPAHNEHPAMAEVVVDPEFRGRGFGSELVSESLLMGGPGARVWAHGDLPAAHAVAQRLSMVSARELLQMRRPLDNPELPDLVVPEGIRLRTYAGPEDDAEILRVNNAAFDWHPEQGGWSEQEIADRRAEEWFDPAGLFIAVDVEDRMLGFHWTKVHTEVDPAIGEVYVVAIDPAAQGRGLGRVLTLAGLHHLRDRGLGAVLLYTEADNVAAVHTYERLGFGTFHTDVAYASAQGAT